MKRIAAIFLLLPLLLFASLAQAVPSVDEVQTAVKAGRYAQAETMMREVVASKPESAKAHYVLAEILAHNGQRDEALKETREARRIDPAIKFADPAKFARFEELLQQPRGAAGTGAYTGPNTGTVAAPSAEPRRTGPATSRLNEERAAAAGGGMPSWLWLVGAAVVALVAWRFIASRRTSSSAAAPMAAAGMGMAPGAGYPAAPDRRCARLRRRPAVPAARRHGRPRPRHDGRRSRRGRRRGGRHARRAHAARRP